MDSPLSISSKLPKSGTSIFSVMSALANEQNALNLSQGFPSFDCNKHLKELVNKYIQDKKNQYAPMPGILALREAIAKKTEELYSAKYNPETEITVTAGATLGFLIWNKSPARIYMGDAGALFLGVLLATLTVRLNPETQTQVGSYLTPVFLLAIPILDTAAYIVFNQV
jgi:hypothetical protein